MNSKKKSKIFDSKIFWAVISLILSLLIWVYINGTQEEIIELDFRNVELVFVGEDTLQDSRELIITDVKTRSVDVKISGARMNIGGLSAKDVQAQIDVSRITSAGVNTTLYQLVFPEKVNADAVTILSRNPAQVQFTVTRMATKTVPVKCDFVGTVAEGFVQGELEIEPNTVMISGPQSELDKINHVYAELGGDDQNKTRNVELPYVLRDTDNNVLEDLSGLEFDVSTIAVTLNISATKTVPLDVSLIFGAGANEKNTIVTIEPKTITVQGDSELLENYESCIVSTLDMTDFGLTYEDTFSIKLPDGIKNVTGITEAKVKIELSGLAVKQLPVTNLKYINLPSGYTAEIVNKSIDVKIRAPEDIIDKIKSADLRAVADMVEVTSTGDLSISVKIYVDGYPDAGAVGDYTIIIHVSG